MMNRSFLILDRDLIVDIYPRGLVLLGRNRENILEKVLFNFPIRSNLIQPNGKDTGSFIQEHFALALTGVSLVFE